MPKSGDALTMMLNVKTDRNQAKQKAIVGIVVGLVKKQNQESPKTLGLQRVVYFLQCRLNSIKTVCS